MTWAATEFSDLDLTSTLEFNLIYTTAFHQGKASRDNTFTGFEEYLAGWKSEAQKAIAHNAMTFLILK